MWPMVTSKILSGQIVLDRVLEASYDETSEIELTDNIDAAAFQLHSGIWRN